MIPAHTYDSICDSMEREFVRRVRITDDNTVRALRYSQTYSEIEEYETIFKTDKVKMVGILFVQPSHKIAKDEILPNIKYYHIRSRTNVNFYLAGYGAYLDRIKDVEVVCSVDRTDWQYSATSFNNLREEIENRSNWQYSGECDLIIINARYNKKESRVILDFTCCVAININDLIRVGVITSTMKLFEDIFRYAEAQRHDDPTWGLSDELGFGSSKEGLKNIILNLLPSGAGKEIEKVSKFAVINISKVQ